MSDEIDSVDDLKQVAKVSVDNVFSKFEDIDDEPMFILSITSSSTGFVSSWLLRDDYDESSEDLLAALYDLIDDLDEEIHRSSDAGVRRGVFKSALADMLNGDF